MPQINFMNEMGIAMVVGIIAMMTSVRILKEYERAVVFRLGRLVSVRGARVDMADSILDRADAAYEFARHRTGCYTAGRDHQGQRLCERERSFDIPYRRGSESGG